jgi:hypothetical protein
MMLSSMLFMKRLSVKARILLEKRGFRCLDCRVGPRERQHVRFLASTSSLSPTRAAVFHLSSARERSPRGTRGG